MGQVEAEHHVSALACVQLCGLKSTQRHQVLSLSLASWDLILLTLPLYSRIIVIIQGLWDCVTSLEGDVAALTSCSTQGCSVDALLHPLCSWSALTSLWSSSPSCESHFKRNPGHLCKYSAVKTYSSLSLNVVFIKLKPFEHKPFTAIWSWDFFTGLTYSSSHSHVAVS